MCSCTPVPSRARGHRLFEETQKVEFAITQGPPGPKGPQATNVRPVAYGGIPDFGKPEVLTRSGSLGAPSLFFDRSLPGLAGWRWRSRWQVGHRDVAAPFEA